MESKYRTLFSVLNALLAENDLLGWNVAPQKSGCVLVKIRISNMEDCAENSKVDCTVDMPDHRPYCAYEECIADHELCASGHSPNEIQVTQLPESPDILIPRCEIDENDNVSICSELSDNPRSVEPCEHKGCSYGPAVESRKEFYDNDIYYCCDCKNNPFYPDVTLCSDCLIIKNRHKKHKRHARCVIKHEPPLGNWRWAVCAPK